MMYGYYYFSRDLPDFSNIFDYNPQAVTNVYAADGTLVAEFFDERRYPVPLKEIPLFVRHSFLAAEDASFYEHFGIDPVGILRAVLKNLAKGSARQGASTITQQVIKNVLLTREKSIKRKVKEAILAYRLEQELTKDQILEIYLNQIYFGNGAYGIKAASKTYYHKELDELTLAEAAMLAGLPKAPSRYSPVANYDAARQRQRYVLDQMVRAGFVTREAGRAALHEEIKVYPNSTDKIYYAPYYVTEVRRRFSELWEQYDIDSDGLEIHTALDLEADRLAQKAVKKGLREVDKRRGWRGPIATITDSDKQEFMIRFKDRVAKKIKAEELYPAMVTAIRGTAVDVDLGYHQGSIDLKEAKWATKFLIQNEQDILDEEVRWIKPEQEINIGDVIEVSGVFKKDKEQPLAAPELSGFILDQIPQVEGALVILDPHSGKVVSTIGGYDYTRSQFNRATQGKRQPGSSFKPVIYLAAVDEFGYTPSTVVYDEPRTFKVGTDYWTPANYDRDFLGPITLRTALQKSRNLVSADIISRIGVDAAIRYARKMGIRSPLGRNLSLSLGSSEVSPLEITRAYGVFAARGVLFDSVFVTRVVDREGNIIYSYEDSKLSRAEEVISEKSAFVMANMMKGVVEYGTGYRVKAIGRPVAGKTGTSNDQMDGWFVGYTPEWACGAWVGFDQKKTIGKKETGGQVAAPIWLYFMEEFLNYRDEIKYQQLVEEAKEEASRLGIEHRTPEKLKPLDFPVPEGVDPYLVNKQTGLLTDNSDPRAFTEYFINGTEPRRSHYGQRETEENYWDLPEL